MTRLRNLWTRFQTFLREHPGWRKPSIATIILWIVILVGGGVALLAIHISDQNTTRQVRDVAQAGQAKIEKVQNEQARAHNAEACTLRYILGGFRDRAIKTTKDKSVSKSTRDRAVATVKQLDFILDGQITQPPNLDCKALLKSLKAQKAHDNAK